MPYVRLCVCSRMLSECLDGPPGCRGPLLRAAHVCAVCWANPFPFPSSAEVRVAMRPRLPPAPSPAPLLVAVPFAEEATRDRAREWRAVGGWRVGRVQWVRGSSCWCLLGRLSGNQGGADAKERRGVEGEETCGAM
jgi:hypothetical protein